MLRRKSPCLSSSDCGTPEIAQARNPDDSKEQKIVNIDEIAQSRDDHAQVKDLRDRARAESSETVWRFSPMKQ